MLKINVIYKLKILKSVLPNYYICVILKFLEGKNRTLLAVTSAEETEGYRSLMRKNLNRDRSLKLPPVIFAHISLAKLSQMANLTPRAQQSAILLCAQKEKNWKYLVKDINAYLNI